MIMRTKFLFCAFFTALMSFVACQSTSESPVNQIESTDFYSYSGTNEVIKVVVSTMKSEGDAEEFAQSYLKKYGLPLWEHAEVMLLDNMTYCLVPVVDNNLHETKAILGYKLFKDHADFYTVCKSNETKSDPIDFNWMFDFFTMKIYGELLDGKMIITPHEDCVTRAVYTTYIYLCSRYDVFNDNGEFLFGEEHCWGEYVLVFDDWNEVGGGSVNNDNFERIVNHHNPSDNNDDDPPLTYTTPFFGIIFDTSAYVGSTRLFNMFREILEDQIGEKLLINTSRMAANEPFPVVQGNKNSFDRVTNIITLRDDATKFDFFRVLFYIYQSEVVKDGVWDESYINREVESYFAEYMYFERCHNVNNSKWINPSNDARYESIVHLSNVVDESGKMKNNVTEEAAKHEIENTCKTFLNCDMYANKMLLEVYTLNFTFNSVHFLSE